MKPAAFDYHRPETLDEALELMADGEAKVLAGGQSLVPLMSMRLASPARIVDINRLPGLADITTDGSGMRVGAVARHRDLERYDDAARHGNLLPRQATAHVAHATIRNRGTTVGSLVHADPAAEMPAVLRLLGGSVEAVSIARGSRTITADQLFVGPLESALEPDEIAVAATFPHPAEGTGTGWVELSRRHGDYALVGVGAVVTTDHDGKVVSASVGLISVAAVPVVVDLAPVLGGRVLDGLVDDTDDEALGAVAEQVDDAIDPEGDIHASAEYRRHLARALARRAVVAAVRHAVDWSPWDPSDDEWAGGAADDD